MNIRLSTKEQEKMVLDNYRLVGSVVKKFKSKNVSQEDLFSVGTIGLIKAAIKFDASKGIKFSTFANSCIKNEICLYLKDEIEHYSRNVSLDAPVKSKYGESKDYYEIFFDIKINNLKQIEDRELVTRYINIVLNALEPINRLVILYRISGMTFRSISEILGISKQNISAREKKSKEKMNIYLNKIKMYNQIYKMDIVDNLYTISFSSNDVQNFNKIFAIFLQNHGSSNDLIGFKVNYHKELVVLKVPAQPESFALIAEIIREIDNYNLEFVGNPKIKVSKTGY